MVKGNLVVKMLKLGTNEILGIRVVVNTNITLTKETKQKGKVSCIHTLLVAMNIRPAHTHL